MTTEERLAEAMKLLNEAVFHFADNETAPNSTWCKRFFMLDGSHMILTEDGWESGEMKAQYVKESEENGNPLSELIKDEVNAPV